MLKGDNPNTVTFEGPTAVGSASADGNVSMRDVINDLKERRDNVLAGGINCIPWPIESFRGEIPGIEQEQYIVITAQTKAGKTQFSSYVYLFYILDYVHDHQSQCSVHVIYFNMEESQMRIKQRYISYLLYKMYNIRIPPSDLRSTSADFPLTDDILAKIESPEFMERLDFFDECVQFEAEDTNPTGMLRVCEEYARSVGEYTTYKRKSRNNPNQMIEVFKSYKPYDKKHYTIVLTDHAGLIDLERGMNLKATMDKWSEYCVKYLRNRYKQTVVNIQQQAMEVEGLEAIKQKKMVPSVATLGDTKYTARDANLVIGLFDPSFFGLPTWLGYKIQDADGTGLRGYARFAYVLRGRDGEQGGVSPMFFDGAVCNFEGLPAPDNLNEISKYYTRAASIKSYRQKRKLASLGSMVLSLFIKHK